MWKDFSIWSVKKRKKSKEGTLEFNLSIWKEGVGCKWDEGRWGRRGASFGHTEIEMLIIRPRGEEKRRADIIWGGVSTWIMVKTGHESHRVTSGGFSWHPRCWRKCALEGSEHQGRG